MATDYNFKYQRQTVGGPFVYVSPQSASGNQFFGEVGLTAGSALVSAPLVQADSLIRLTLKRHSAAGAITGVYVTSVAAGVGFHIGTGSGLAFAGSYAVQWELVRRS